MHEQRRVRTAWVAASEKEKFTGEVSGFMISWLRLGLSGVNLKRDGRTE